MKFRQMKKTEVFLTAGEKRTAPGTSTSFGNMEYAAARGFGLAKWA
jgi:hypothetical protein